MDRGEPTYQTYRKPQSLKSIVIPLALLVAVVAIVSGLLLGGVIQGHEDRAGVPPATTQPSVLIVP